MNPNLRIVARLIEEEARAKLIKAGADAIVSTNFIGGLRMASEMVRPTVVSFLDRMLRAAAADVRVSGAKIPPGSKLIGSTLAEAKIYEKTGLTVISIARGDTFELNASPDTRLQEGNELIVCCTSEQLRKLNEVIAA